MKRDFRCKLDACLISSDEAKSVDFAALSPILSRAGSFLMRLKRQTDFPIGTRYTAIGADGGQRILPEMNGDGAISIADRQLNPHIEAFLERIDFSRLGTIRLAGSAENVCKGISLRLTSETLIPPILASWLYDDIDNLIRLFGRMTAACEFLVRLEAVGNDGCSRFHADNVRYRLVTTYLGPGTEWVSPPHHHNIHAEMPALSGAVKQLETGSIAIMRGRKAETKAMPAILHRSPPMRGIEQPRLFLAIDDLADHSLTAADNL